MKTKFFLMMGLLVFAGIISGQNQNRQSKKAAQEASVKKAIDSERFQLVVDQAQPMGWRVVHLTSEYTLALSKDSAVAFLPYYGRAYSAAYGSGGGGIKFAEPVKEKKVVFNEKKKSYTISFKVKTTEDYYQFIVSVWLNGSASVSVNCTNRQPISFTGQLKLTDK